MKYQNDENILCPLCCTSARQYDEQPKLDGEVMPLLSFGNGVITCPRHGNLDGEQIAMISDGHKVIFSAA